MDRRDKIIEGLLVECDRLQAELDKANALIADFAAGQMQAHAEMGPIIFKCENMKED